MNQLKQKLQSLATGSHTKELLTKTTARSLSTQELKLISGGAKKRVSGPNPGGN